MILSFADRTTADIYDGTASRQARRIDPRLWPLVARRLDALNAATRIEDLQVPPGNRLEKLRGNFAGYWSIRVNERYRIVFKFEAGNASGVRCLDYH